jgi:septal ring factor EnvC (AmiA/AmiB activator)
MFKKVLIAALAVVVGLAVVKGTWIGSHLRLRCSNARHWMETQIPPEQEIARLRMELASLAKEDDKHYDKVARMAVDVDNQEKSLGTLRTKLTREEVRIRKLKSELGDGVDFVDFEGARVYRSDLRNKAIAFKNAEENLKSKDASLEAKKRHLALERKKLAELGNKRAEMATELQRLETALAEERQAQAASESTIDDSSYRQIRKDMDSVRDRINVLKKKRELRGEFAPAVETNKPTEQDVQADKYLDTRFSDNKEVVSKKSEK